MALTFDRPRWARTIFVFGSNKEGAHGKGAALIAKQQHGAIQGHSHGPQGRAYAIPTKGRRPGPRQPFPILTLREIARYVREFEDFAVAHPDWRFNVTAIGCGLAGYRPDEVAPMFSDCDDLGNVYLPEVFVKCLHRWPAHRTSFDRNDQLVD